MNGTGGVVLARHQIGRRTGNIRLNGCDFKPVGLVQGQQGAVPMQVQQPQVQQVQVQASPQPLYNAQGQLVGYSNAIPIQ